MFTHQPIYPKFSDTKEHSKALDPKDSTWQQSWAFNNPPKMSDSKIIQMSAVPTWNWRFEVSEPHSQGWQTPPLDCQRHYCKLHILSVLLTLVQNCSRCKIYLWRKVVCLFDRMRSANAQSASCHTPSMVGELLMSKGASNWFHDVSTYDGELTEYWRKKKSLKIHRNKN